MIERVPQNPFDMIVTLLAVALGAAVVVAIQPVPELGFILQCSGIGGIVGAAAGVASRRRHGPGVVGLAIGYGTVGGCAVGILVLVLDALLT